MIRLIKNGRIIDPANNEDAVRDLIIEDELIVATNHPPEGLPDDRIIDAKGCWVIPGIVDLAARFREPGHEHKATISSESRAALAGGITSVCLQPDTQPVVDTPAVVDLIQQRAHSCDSPHLYTLGAMSLGLKGKQLSEYAALKSAGCIGVSNANQSIGDNQFMRNIMDYAASLQLKVFLTPVDNRLAMGGLVHEGRVSTRLGLPAIPAAAETVTVSRDLILIEATGVQAHFCRLSCAQSIEMIARAKQRGLPVSADVSAHQLFLSDVDVSDFDSNTHVQPPLRSGQDRDALRCAVRDNVIDTICSDHQPHEADAKLAPFGETSPGISALETLLPLTLKLVHENILDPIHAIRAITHGPASVMGIAAGSLSAGSPADIVIIDPQAHWTFDTSNSLSRGKNTPFHNWQFQGRVTHTLVSGNLLYHSA